MVPLLLIAQLSIAMPQERVVVLRDKATGKITGSLRSSGPRPTPSEGLAILCPPGRCEPPPTVDPEPRLIPIRVSREPQAANVPDSFRLYPLPGYQPTPSVQSVPLPEPTVRVILEQPISR